MPDQLQSKPTYYSLSLHSGGILAGSITRIQLERLESETRMSIRDLFPAGIVSSSVGQFAAGCLTASDPNDITKPLYTAKQYGELFDIGSFALSNETIEKPYSARLKQELNSIVATILFELVPNSVKPHLPQWIQDKAHNVHMDTSEFDTLLKEYLGHIKLKDLHGSVIFTAGRVDRDPRKQSAHFAKLIKRDGEIKYSSTTLDFGVEISHEDISLYDIVKAGSSIPGAMRGHYIDSIREMFNDNGHVFNAATHVDRLRKHQPLGVKHGHVMLGKARFFLPEEFNSASGYNRHGFLGLFRGGVYKDTTCNQAYSDSLESLRRTLGKNRFHDLSLIIDPEIVKTFGYDRNLPIDNLLLNTPKQRKAIEDIAAFYWEFMQADEMKRTVDLLGENALKIKEMRIRGDFIEAHDFAESDDATDTEPPDNVLPMQAPVPRMAAAAL